jgi:hypothetical protein
MADLSRDGAEIGAASDRRRIAVAATWVLALTLLVVNGYLLTSLGVPYATSAGAMAAKIHPATYLSLVVVLTWAWATGGLGRLVARVAVTRPGALVFGFGIVLLFYQTVAVVRLPVTPVLDTFVMPLLVFVALDHLTGAERERLATVLHGVIALNALIALAEYATGWRLTPLYEADGTVMTYEWRASALFGHPLLNAFITGNYLVALAFGAAPRLPPLIRAGLMGLAALSLIAFGGRVAMVVGLAMAVFAGLIGGGRLLVGGRFDIRHAVAVIAAVTVAVLFFVIFVDVGGADRFIARFSDDHGSAQTRLSMLKIFGDLTHEQFLLWPDSDLIAKAQREYSLRIGVESSEVGFVANYGLLVTIAFFLALAAFLRELVASTSLTALWSIVYFTAVMSSSLGIASKTTVLGTFVVFTLALFTKPPSPSPAT